MEKLFGGEYNKCYLIQYRSGSDSFQISTLALEDEEIEKIKNDKTSILKKIGNEDFVSLSNIGSAYSTILNEEVFNLVKENCVLFYKKQIENSEKWIKQHKEDINKILDIKMDTFLTTNRGGEE